jgi:hypothetical protein
MTLTPPTYATRVAGNVRSAELLTFDLNHPKGKKKTVAQKLGLAYERKALKMIENELDTLICPHPTFRYNSGHGLDQYAIPDAIYLKDEVLTIFEIKLSHSADAWHQLNNLYKPIVQKAYPHLHINLCEVCRNYDRSIKLPRVEFVDDLARFASSKQDKFGIYIWSR